MLLMSALSAGGMPLLRTMMIAHRARDLIGVDVELDYVGRHILMGDSLSDALRQVARLTPSPRFREYLEGLAGIAETGVNVYDYNRAFLGRVFMEFREALRDLVEKMSLVMEILVSIGVILPILVVTLVLFVGRYMRLPADPGALAGLFTFVVVPLIFIVLAIMVDAMITKVYG
ncbi:TPA: hypothetical protein EYP38_00355 [Candidatus Micrarchaeota archaeon]|nr:hypothetical protein [Candidatus Micrarchaeota archaeon]